MSSHRELTRQVRTMRTYITAHKVAAGAALSKAADLRETVPVEVRDELSKLYTQARELKAGCIALIREHGKA